MKPKYLVTFTVGINQKKNIDAAVKKVYKCVIFVFHFIYMINCYSAILRLILAFWQFSEDFTILLFHYDGRTSEWDEFEWSKKAIHVSAKRQAKW